VFKKRIYIVILFVVILLSSFYTVQKNDVEEYVAKAAFIYNFTKFVEWNNDANSESFVIGVVGESPIYSALTNIASTKKINNKKIEVVKCKTTDVENCHCQILFVPENIGTKEFKDFLSALSTKNVLVITEHKGYLDYGSAINFLIVDNHIKFEINLTSLNKCNLKASAQLLKLAQSVQN